MKGTKGTGVDKLRGNPFAIRQVTIKGVVIRLGMTYQEVAGWLGPSEEFHDDENPQLFGLEYHFDGDWDYYSFYFKKVKPIEKSKLVDIYVTAGF
jgi:hypothetical protein